MTTLANWARARAYNQNQASLENTQPISAIPYTENRINLKAFRIAALFSIFYVIVGFILIYRFGIISGDSFSRVYNAFAVVSSNNFNLADIGFIWNPLPTILEIPLVALHNWWPPLTRDGLAGIFVSSFFGGIAVFDMYKVLFLLGLKNFYKTIITILFGLNPLIVFYSSNGMSDIMLLAAMLGVAYGVMNYIENQHISNLVSASLWLAIGFGARYEAGIYALVAGIALIALLSIPKVLERQKGVGILMVLELPIIYSVGIWITANWIIMGNPLYFLNSQYGNAAQVATGAYKNTHTSGNVLAALSYVAERSVIFPPLIIFLAITIWMLIKNKTFKKVWIILALGTAEPIIQLILLTLGKSAGWERFFIFYIPLGFMLGAFVMTKLIRRLRIFALILLVIGNLFTLTISNTTSFGNGTNSSISDIIRGTHLHPFESITPVENYFDAYPKTTVLVDSFTGWSIIMRSRNPRQFITTDNINFKSILNHPLGKVQAILVPKPIGVSKLDAINRKYPGLWYGKLPWAHLVLSTPDGAKWKVYKLNTP